MRKIKQSKTVIIENILFTGLTIGIGIVLSTDILGLAFIIRWFI